MSLRPPFREVAAREAADAVRGLWSERGIVELLVTAMRDHPRSARVRCAALAFEADVRRAPLLAGNALAEFVSDVLPAEARG